MIVLHNFVNFGPEWNVYFPFLSITDFWPWCMIHELFKMFSFSIDFFTCVKLWKKSSKMSMLLLSGSFSWIKSIALSTNLGYPSSSVISFAFASALILVEILDDILEPICKPHLLYDSKTFHLLWDVVHHTVTLTLISFTATQTYGQYALPFLMGIIFGSSFFLDLRDQAIPKSPVF